MPVNPLSILIPLLLVWGAFAYFLFRWRRWAGGMFTGLSVIALVVHIMNTNVERQFDEQMPFRIIEIGDYRTLEFTNSRRDTVTTGSSNVVARVRSRSNQTVRVSMVAWYDYGRLRAFRVERVLMAPNHDHTVTTANAGERVQFCFAVVTSTLIL